MTGPTAHPVDDARINEDRECPNCGYNLRGLSKGGTCPECGRKIGGKTASRYRDNLTYAAPSYLRTLCRGLWIMAASLPILPFSLCFAAAAPIGSGVWALGAWIALTKRPLTDDTRPDAVLDSDKLRAVARWMQLPLVVGSVLLWLGMQVTAGTPVATILGVLAGLSLLAGVVGYIPLSIYLTAIADWASHESAAGRLRASAWFMCVLGAGMAVCFGVPVLRFFGLWLFVAWLTSVVVFLVTIVQLANAVQWAVKNQRYAEGSAARVAQRKAKRLAAPSVVHDMECRRCGYDLEGMPFGGACPECGESYADATPLPIRDVPRRAPEDEAPLPLADDEDGEANRDKTIRFSTRFGSEQHAAGGPTPRSGPDPSAPRPFKPDPADPDGEAIPLEPEGPER
ncbi:MAG: hypothetical protein RIB60_04880 [Phycisphaerales bacterium]